MKDQSQKNNSVNDPELKEWLDALENIINEDGNNRASFILGKLASKLTESGTIPDFNLTTPFRNSIPVNEEAKMPGDLFMERKIRSLIRWNALALVLRANKNDDDYDSIECINYVQNKMICLLSILIVTTILLVFVSIIIWK